MDSEVICNPKKGVTHRTELFLFSVSLRTMLCQQNEQHDINFLNRIENWKSGQMR